MSTTSDYRGLVRLKDGSKEKYNIAKAAGTVEDAIKCLMHEVPNVLVALVLVPPSEHFVEPQVA